MRTYYDSAGITIYHGDWREEAEPFAGCDLIIADPPYGETSLDWDKWPYGWPDALLSVMPRNASLWCFGSARMFLEHAEEFLWWHFVQDIVWEKQNGSGFANDRFKRVHESIYQFTPHGTLWGDVYKNPQVTMDATRRAVRAKGRPPHMGKIGENHYVSEDGGPRLMRSVIFNKNCHGYAENETQKPVELVGILCRYSCPPGGLIGSPFTGSGTDLVAAKANGMRGVGYDVRESQCEIAARRLAQEVMDL